VFAASGRKLGNITVYPRLLTAAMKVRPKQEEGKMAGLEYDG
jgi:hypothetical protein